MVHWCSAVFKKILLWAFFPAAFIFASYYYLFFYFPHRALAENTDLITIELPLGSSVRGIAKQLEEEGILTHSQARLFCWWIQCKGIQTLLKAGVYTLTYNMTPQALLDKLIKGDVAQYALTLREGETIANVLEILAQHPAIKNDLADKSHSDLMTLLGEPHLFAEGLFFPDTYYFNANTSDIDFLRRARKTMEQKLMAAWEKRDPDIAINSPYEALILASIIEKETAKDNERFIISGVFHRRIQKNMRLQADPTVAYGIKEFIKPLTKAHLKQDTPYNTYRYKGLPPTPIGLPSMQSINAALHPQEGDSLYFVSKGDGTHHFSATLDEHNEAVAKYRRGNKNE